MRCQDCNKFVSHECEVDDSSIDFDESSAELSGSVTKAQTDKIIQRQIATNHARQTIIRTIPDADAKLVEIYDSLAAFQPHDMDAQIQLARIRVAILQTVGEGINHDVSD